MEPIQPRGPVTPPAAAKPAASKQTNRVSAVAATLNETLSGPRSRTGYHKPAAPSTRQALPGDTIARFAHADRTIHEAFIDFQEQLDVKVNGKRTIRTVDEAIAESLQDPAAQEALAKERADLEALARRLDEEERAQAAQESQIPHSYQEDLELARRLDAEEKAAVSKLPVKEAKPASTAEEAWKALDEAEARVAPEEIEDQEMAEAIRLSLQVAPQLRPAAAEAPAMAWAPSEKKAEEDAAIDAFIAEFEGKQPEEPDGFVLMEGGELPKAEMQKLAEQTISAAIPKDNKGQDGNCIIS